MIRHLKRIISCIVFLSILVSSLYGINRVMESKYVLMNTKYPTTSTYSQFYKMERDSIDVLFFGSSVVVNAFIPQEIYNDYGIRSYNLGSEQQSIFVSYYWLKEALRYQKPRAVVLDVLFMWDLHKESKINMSEGLVRKSFEPMQWSPVKREAVHELCRLDEAHSEESYYFTNLRYHSRWTELKEYDFKRNMVSSYPLKGYSPIVGDGPDSYTPFEPSDPDATMEFQPIMQEYLDKFVELCKENNIDLILIDMPGNGMHDGVNNAHTAYAEEKGIEYMNLCNRKYYDKLGADLPRVNVVGHPNVPGAINISKYMGGILHDSYGLEPVYDEQYEASREYYDHVLKNSDLFYINDAVKYFETIKDPEYAVFIAGKGDSSGTCANETAKQGLKNLGLSCGFGDIPGCSYAATIIGGQVTDEEASLGKVTHTGSFRSHNSVYTVTSCNKESGNLSSILIDGEEYSRDSQGLNIAVYDLATLKVVDQATLIGSSLVR